MMFFLLGEPWIWYLVVFSHHFGPWWRRFLWDGVLILSLRCLEVVFVWLSGASFSTEIECWRWFVSVGGLILGFGRLVTLWCFIFDVVWLLVCMFPFDGGGLTQVWTTWTFKSLRYTSIIYPKSISQTLWSFDVELYKFRLEHSLLFIAFPSFINYLVTEFVNSDLCLCSIPSLSLMDKGKQKIADMLFSDVVKTSAVENKKTTLSRDNNLPSVDGANKKSKNKKVTKKNSNLNSKTEVGDSSNGVSPISAASFFSKLSLVKENFQVLHDTTLLGFLVGKHIDFNKKISKLKYDWKNLNGGVEFFYRQMGWFEIRFSNPVDKTQIWEGRPYHFFSQLLLLKPWSSAFNPTTESIFQVDMWVRIPFFPPEYYNHDAISTILEYNNVGKLIKLDPNSNKRNWAKFARFCINLDCSDLVNREVLIPNENGELKKFYLWFEDIPKGCGNCGGLDHGFNNCPLRRFIPPKFQIRFRKHEGEASQVKNTENEWHTALSKAKKRANNASKKQADDSQKKEEDYGGIAVVYVTDGSSANSKESSKPSSKNSKSDSVKSEDNAPDPAVNEVKTGHVDTLDLATHEACDNKQITDLWPVPEVFEVSTPTVDNEIDAHGYSPDDYYFEDNYGDEQFTMNLMVDEVPFLDGPIGSFTNQELPLVIPMVESASFLSMNYENSLLKQAHLMEGFGTLPSSSGSSKRKNPSGEADTASSGAHGLKKAKTLN